MAKTAFLIIIFLNFSHCGVAVSFSYYNNMKNSLWAFIGLAGLTWACSTSVTPVEEDLTQYVNPFIGTDFTGNTYPGAQVPFGMVQLSPDNGLPGWDRIAGYYYPDSTIAGFSHTHLSGTGAGDLYDISFMPVTLPYVEAEAPLGVHSKFSHEKESASAGYYQVFWMIMESMWN